VGGRSAPSWSARRFLVRRGEPQLIQPGDDGLAEPGPGHLDQGRAAPEFQRLAQRGAGRGRIGAQLGLARGGQLLEPDYVDVPSIATCTRSILPARG